jgi:hypothetical protein
MLSNPLPKDPYRAVLWFFYGPGQWSRLGEITVSLNGVRKWSVTAKNRGIDVSWEAGICPGWSYVFPLGTGPDDCLYLLD